MAKQVLASSGNVSVAKASGWVTLQEYVLANDSSQIAFQIVNGTTGNLQVQILGRIVAAGTTEVLLLPSEVSASLAKQGSYPAPAGATQTFRHAIPKCIYSVIVQVRTDGGTGNCSVQGIASDI